MATKEEIKKKLGIVGLPDAFKPKISPAPAPAPAPAPIEEAKQPSGEVKVFRDKSGRLSGVTLPDGRTLLGLSPNEVRSIAQKFAKEAETPAGAVEAAQARQQERQLKALEAGLGEAGAFEGAPEEREIMMEQVAGTGEILGKISPEVRESLGAIKARNLIAGIDQKEIAALGLDEFRTKVETAVDLSPEEQAFLLELIKTETDLEVLKSREGTASQLGALTEALTTESIAKWIPGVTTPTEAVRNIEKELTIIESDLREDGRFADRGILDPQIALDNANRYEERIVQLQSKLRFLIAQSSQLRNSPEGVDALNQKINGIIGGIADTRTRAAQGAIERQVLNPDEAYFLFQQMKRRQR